MEKSIFIFDEKSKLVKECCAQKWRILFCFTIDFILIGIICGIFSKTNYGEISFDTFKPVIIIGFIYMAYDFIMAFYRPVKISELKDKVIVKTANNIKFITTDFITFEAGLIDPNEPFDDIRYMLEDSNKKPTKEEVDIVLSTLPEGFHITEYSNCELIKETSKYYKFRGELNNAASEFKIYKVYSNINENGRGIAE